MAVTRSKSDWEDCLTICDNIWIQEKYKYVQNSTKDFNIYVNSDVKVNQQTLMKLV